LYWEDASVSGISSCDALGDLVIGHYNGSDFESFSNAGGVSGSCTGTGAGYVTASNVSSFSPFTFGSKSSGLNALPIELMSFTANENNGAISLNWSTASEINNDYFTIERSEDAIEFTEIDIVVGAGNSSTTLSYNLVDIDPIVGVSYYRLKQTDFDGEFKYSETVSVTYNESNENEPAILIFPNPVYGDKAINVLISNYPANAEVTIILRDNTGRASYSNTIITNGNGLANEAIESYNDLEPGMYFISVIANGVYETARVVVLK
jgi:hypothetical protein